MSGSQVKKLAQTETLSDAKLDTAMTQLRLLPIFAAVPDREFEALKAGIAIRSYRAGASVVKHAAPANSCFVVVSGTLFARRINASGKELRLGTMQPGAIVGELALLTGGKRTCDVLADEPSIVAEISEDSFRKLLRVAPEFSYHLLTTLAERVESTSTRLNELSFLDLHERLLQTLIRFATTVELNGETRILVRELPSQQILASLLSCSREAVSRALKDLETRGVIRVNDEQVEIL